eukprot:98609_1
MSLQLNFEDFLLNMERKQIEKKNAEIRLDLNRLAPQNSGKKQNNHSKGKRRRKRSRKVWETQALKDALEQKESTVNTPANKENTTRAKTRVYLHKVLLNTFDELHTKKRKLNHNAPNNTKRHDELNYLCNDIENAMYLKCDQKINKHYMECSRDLLFNLKQNNALQLKLIHRNISAEQLVNMQYTELATDELAKNRKQFEKQRLDKVNSTLSEKDHNWIECSNVECSNCGSHTCKYKTRKTLVFETTKSVVYGQISSKQQNVDMICTKCSYSFKHEISFN